MVTARGGALRELQHHGRDLVVSFEPEGRIRLPGVICAAWLNRLADGCYSYAGKDSQAAANKPERGAALHGLAADRCGRCRSLWRVSPSLPPCRGGAPDEWTLELPAQEFLEMTPDRLLPVGMKDMAGHDFDFRNARRLGPVRIDPAFAGISRDGQGLGRVRVQYPAGTGVELESSPARPWVQIHTADKPVGPDRPGLAVEPMTCPPDAFNSGSDVIHLKPGESHSTAWTNRALA